MPLNVRFSGEVECRHAPGASALTLAGRTEDGPIHLTLLGVAPPGLPPRLASALVVEREAQLYRISSSAGEWTVTASRAFLHRDLSGALARAIPPRPARWRTRLIWRLVLGAAATRIGRWWLNR